MGGKKKNSNKAKELALFKKSVLSSFEDQRKIRLLQKEETIQKINKCFELTKFLMPPEVLRMRMKDLETVDICKGTVQTNEEQSTDFQVSGVARATNLEHLQLEDSCAEFRGSVDVNYRNTISKYIITPKVNPYSPISMLRVPNIGEFAVSAAGSPLQVSCMANDTASINIPLKNGKTMSVLPKPGINTNIIQQNLEPSVKKQLQTLQDAISKILS